LHDGEILTNINEDCVNDDRNVNNILMENHFSNNGIIVPPIFIEKKDGKGSILFEKGSLPYGNKDGDVELKMVSYQEYKYFEEKKVPSHKSRNQFENISDYIKDNMDVFDQEEKQGGLTVIDNLVRRGEFMKNVKIKYLKNGDFEKECHRCGKLRVYNMPKTFYLRNATTIFNLLQSEQNKTIELDPNGIQMYNEFKKEQHNACKNILKMGIKNK